MANKAKALGLVSILAVLLCSVTSIWKPANAAESITDILCEELEVTITVDYNPLSSDSQQNPPPGNDYRVKSAVNLTCTANTPNEGLFFNWTSTCNGSEQCFVARDSSSNIVSTSDLQRYDAGVHTCTVYDTVHGCHKSVSITMNVVGFKVLIQPIYTPPDQYPDYGPPNYRAASSVTLRCVAKGTVGAVQFSWESTCDNCFVRNNSFSATISESILTHRDSGVHVCKVLDSTGSIGINSTQMNIVGAGIYVIDGNTNGVTQASQPNNTLITPDRLSTISRSINLYCCSSSTLPVSFTFPDGYTSHHNQNRYPVQFASLGRTYSGCTQLSIQRSTDSRLIPGVYTCNAQLPNGEMTRIGFGLYSIAFSDAPTIRLLEYTTFDTKVTLKCMSEQSPPTNVTWLRNGEKIATDEDSTHISQQVLDRSDSVYETTLTIVNNPSEYTGNYTCLTGNSFGTDYRELSIQALQITKTVDRLIVGQNATITCSSDLHVTSVEWLTIPRVGEMNNSYAQFHLSPISTDDWGIVRTCKVTASFGILEEKYTLRPEVPEKWSHVEITGSSGFNPLQGSQYTLTCTVNAIDGLNTRRSIEWIVPNKNINFDDDVTYSKTNTKGRLTTSTLTFNRISTGYGGEYSCRARVYIPWLSTQLQPIRSRVNVEVKTQQNIQLLIFGKGPLLYCTNLDIKNAQALEEAIKRSIEVGVREICNCDFSSTSIHSGRFSCQAEATSVTYRATVDGSNESYAAHELVQFIEQWRENQGNILYTIFELKVANKQQCPLSIATFDDPECE